MSKGNGCDFYVKGTCSFDVYFQNGFTDCRHCEYRMFDKNFQTYECYLTKEYIDKANLDKRGIRCPITFDFDDIPTF